MTEDEFRAKYPHSTEEQVRLYAEAVKAEASGVKPEPEPDIPMPMITRGVSDTPLPVEPDPPAVTTYTVPANRFFLSNFSLEDVPPEVPPVSTASEMRDILLGTFGFNSGLTEAQRQRLQTTDMTEEDMLAMLVGAPNAQEFAGLE